MMYHDNASSIVRRVYIYMSVTNRSISSIEVLKSAASVLVNLTRYRITGPKIYAVSFFFIFIKLLVTEDSVVFPYSLRPRFLRTDFSFHLISGQRSFIIIYFWPFTSTAVIAAKN